VELLKVLNVMVLVHSRGNLIFYTFITRRDYGIGGLRCTFPDSICWCAI